MISWVWLVRLGMLSSPSCSSTVALSPEAASQSITRRPRKRVRTPITWKHNKSQRLRNSGKEYTSSSGKTVSSVSVCLSLCLSFYCLCFLSQVKAKELDSRPCGCSLKCYDKVPLNQREKLFDGFWKLGIFDVQNAYLTGCVKVINVKRRYTVPAQSRRQFSRVYYVCNGEVSTRVCKTAFLRIHAISNGRLSRAIKAAQDNDGSPHQDQRGRHEPRNKTSGDVTSQIDEHIRSFPRYTSHYCRNSKPNRHYLSPDLSVAKMHELYATYCSENGYTPASMWVYRKHFNEHHSLSFGR